MITVRTGAGVSGSDRVEILWGANAVKKAWLEVEVLNTAHTGLPATDVFYWGNMVGDSNLNFATSGVDSANVLANPTGTAAITSTLDHNRSKVVSGTDSSAALANVATLTRINLIAGSMAPVGSGDMAGSGGGGIEAVGAVVADSGIASGLAVTSKGGSGSLSRVHPPDWLAHRLRDLRPSGNAVAAYLEHFDGERARRTRSTLSTADPAAAFGLDDALLDELLADLGWE